ncbi:MAG: carbohydrate-binding domain-containing protein [Erysipelotrichaceae bacterium]|nr:carbohydrate-binding domain-containing protein [Erysipelotrichaceae bacterium]
MKKIKNSYIALLLAASLLVTAAGCNKQEEPVENNNTETQTEVVEEQNQNEATNVSTNTEEEEVEVNLTVYDNSALEVADIFTKRDLKQTVDTSDAKQYTVSDGQTITITEEGIYVISGTAKNAQIVVNTDDSAKVQLVLNSLNVTNDSTPVIYVISADKVFVTSTGDNYLAVTSTFTADGETNTDGVIFSKDDLVLNGTGTMTIKSTDNGVVSKDDLKVTGGTYVINAGGHGLQANDSIAVYDGDFTINASTDGIHCANSDDYTKGYVYIYDGNFKLNVGSDGIEAQTILQIDNGTLDIDAEEGLEATYVQINGGDITISASDDGINGSNKSSAYNTAVEINGGDIDITMAQGDTDALDSNGNLTITGGYINISAQFAFDFDGTVTFTGGTVIVNGSQVTTISNSMMGPGGFGGGQQPGGNGGFGGGPRR